MTACRLEEHVFRLASLTRWKSVQKDSFLSFVSSLPLPECMRGSLKREPYSTPLGAVRPKRDL